jgi:hypothetical protein
MSSFMEPADYEYHHGSGKHVLMKRGDVDEDYNRPRYSLKCVLCQALDCLVLLLVFAFLGGAFYLCYYLYNNYDGGG